MSRLKLSLLLSSLMMLIFVSVACSGSSTNESVASGANNGDREVIDYWHTYGEQEEKVLSEEIKPAFEEEFPEYELKLTRQPVEGLKQQVIAGVSGGAAPDLMRMDIIWTSEFAQMGALANVSDMDGFEESKEKLFESPMSTNFYQGNYYGLPVNTNTKIAIYNKEKLEEAGFSEPPATMEELEEVARVAVDNGVKGAINMVGVGQTWDFLPYFWSLGGSLTNEDYTQFDGYLNSDESLKALETMLGWYEDGLVSDSIIGGEPGTWEGIETGEYLLIDDGPWFFSILSNDESKPDPLDYTVWANIPEGDGGSRAPIGGENLVIFESATNKEGAWKFSKWMTSEKAQIIMAQGTGLIPTNVEAAKDEEFLELPFVEQYVEQLNTALPRTPLPMWSEIDQEISLNFEKVFRGELEPKEALDIAAEQAEKILHE